VHDRDTTEKRNFGRLAAPTCHVPAARPTARSFVSENSSASNAREGIVVVRNNVFDGKPDAPAFANILCHADVKVNVAKIVVVSGCPAGSG